MNRKQRRITQSENKQRPAISLHGKACAIEEAEALAIQEYHRGNMQGAADIFHLITVQVPAHADSYYNRGNVLQEMGRYDEALESYAKAVALNPRFTKAYNNQGNILQKIWRYSEALASYDRAIALQPDDASGYYNRGLVLQKMTRHDAALPSYDKVIALMPNHVDAHNNRGLALHAMGRYAEALESYAKAIALNPGYANAYYNQGSTFRATGRYDEALASYEKAVALNPDIPCLLGDLQHTRMFMFDWRDADAAFDAIAKAVEAGKPVSSPFILTAMPLSLSQQQMCAETFIKNTFPLAAAPLWNGEKYAHERIRIGYFSADLQNHATAFLMAELFELHDRTKFEVTAFSFGPPSTDAMRARLQKAIEHFIDVSAKSDAEIAALARSMEIDIAVDLKGFTKNSRTNIFAMRPAPIQVNYLGYPGTMGAEYMDYIIADPVLIPEAHKPYYTEKIAYLPDSYQVNDSSRKIAEKHFTRQEMGLPENGFVFCCFNNSYKITPDVFDIWMRLLHAVPASVLWLLVEHPMAVKNLQKEAQARGISSDRLVFAKRMDLPDHLARQGLADLFLDTFHYNAHTTASDALWAGLPVLTFLGETFAGRVAASLLNAVGLPEMITHSHAEYKARALELAESPQKLAAIREKLAQNRSTCPLFNATIFTKHIEKAYARMWEKSQTGLPADDIYVS